VQSLLDRAEAVFHLVVALFLLIGLVATVRRVVVVTAEVESYPDGGRELTNFLLELALLAALTIAFAVALYLLRRAPGLDLRTDSTSQPS